MKKELINLLNSYHMSMSPKLLAALKKQLDKKQVTSLNLQTVVLQNTDLQIIMDIINLTPELKQISLKSSDLNRQNLKGLLNNASELAALETFYLEDNTLTDEAANNFAEFVKNASTLKTFYFLSNKLSDEGVQSLTRAVKDNKSINEISLRGSNIIHKGILEVSHLVYFDHITQLSLHTKQLSEKSLSILKKCLSGTLSLKFLDLELETIKDEEVLKDIFSKNTSLTEISFTLTSSEEMSKKLDEYFRGITTRNQLTRDKREFQSLAYTWNKMLEEKPNEIDMNLVASSMSTMVDKIVELEAKLSSINQELLYLRSKNKAQTEAKITETAEHKEQSSSKTPSFFGSIQRAV